MESGCQKNCSCKSNWSHSKFTTDFSGNWIRPSDLQVELLILVPLWTPELFLLLILWYLPFYILGREEPYSCLLHLLLQSIFRSLAFHGSSAVIYLRCSYGVMLNGKLMCACFPAALAVTSSSSGHLQLFLWWGRIDGPQSLDCTSSLVMSLVTSARILSVVNFRGWNLRDL